MSLESDQLLEFNLGIGDRLCVQELWKCDRTVQLMTMEMRSPEDLIFDIPQQRFIDF